MPKDSCSHNIIVLLLLILIVMTAVRVEAQKPTGAANRSIIPTPAPSPVFVINNIIPTPAPTHSPEPSLEPKLDKPAWTYWLTFAAALVAATGVITAAMINRHTSERKRMSDEQVAKDRLDNEREQFRQRELQNEFADIQTRIASTEPIVRANAIFRLAQFGTNVKPNTSEEEPVTSENAPYFIPVMNQLAAALYLEKNATVRRVIKDNIYALSGFTKHSKNQSLLIVQINWIAEANRAAKKQFIKALAEWSVTSRLWETWQTSDKGTDQGQIAHDAFFDFIMSILPLTLMRKVNYSVFYDLLNWESVNNSVLEIESKSYFDIQQEKFRQYRDSLSDINERVKLDATLLPSFDLAAQQLLDTCETLKLVLADLAKPADFPQSELDVLVESIAAGDSESPNLINQVLGLVGATSRNPLWKRENQLNLNDCILCDISFASINLQGACFAASHLQKSFFCEAQIQGADFSHANLQYCDFTCAHLQGADLSCAYVINAELTEAYLEGTRFYGIIAEGTNGNLSCSIPSSARYLSSFDANSDYHRTSDADNRTEWLKWHLEKQVV